MQAVQGYYDGTTIRTLEEINAKPNQRVIITIMDEFIEPQKKTQRSSMRGVISEYANPILAEKEESAWERAMIKKHGNV